MSGPVWVEDRLVLLLHDRLLAEHGGAPGLRDAGLLDSALARPRQLLAYADPDLCDLAAAYAGGLVRNHPFVDGNKRIAFMTAYVFLARNGRRLVAPAAVATTMMMGLAAGLIDEAAFAAWLRDTTTA
jgi:death on curing protein